MSDTTDEDQIEAQAEEAEEIEDDSNLAAWKKQEQEDREEEAVREREEGIRSSEPSCRRSAHRLGYAIERAG